MAKRRTKLERPADAAFNAWITFVLYAVVGRTAQADELMRRRKGEVLEVGQWFLQRQRVKLGCLYRGVLVRPDEIKGGHWLEHDQRLEFLSYSQSADVACWFANPNSIISGDVLARRPNVRGYIISGKGDLNKLVWHHAWSSVPVEGGGVLPLVGAAVLHPEIDEEQFAWNLKTQQEVILAPPKRSPAKFHVDPVEKRECGDVEELDARFTFPPFLHMRYGR